MRRVEIVAGQSYGRLLSVCAVNGQEWLFSCECGAIVKRRKYLIANGKTKSCGCLRREMVTAKNESHGMCGTPTYRNWKGMHARCYVRSSSRFENYGGRGIQVEQRWHDFENFLADMGTRPEGMSLDRIDVNGNYGPGNCRWASAIQQARNKSNNRHVTAFGKTLCLMEWQHLTGIDRRKIADRLARGWSPERSLTP